MDQFQGLTFAAIGGQSGAAASITAGPTSGQMTIAGLTGMSSTSVNHFLTLAGTGTLANAGTFPIVSWISATSVLVGNASGVSPDANNGSISWTEETVTLSYPLTVGVPDDGDTWDAAEFAPGYEGLAERTAATAYATLTEVVVAYTSPGTYAFTIPPGCSFIGVDMCGGGGGGEGGGGGLVTGFNGSCTVQGGGGGGAPRVCAKMPVTPGDVLTIVVGAGGGAGSGGLAVSRAQAPLQAPRRRDPTGARARSRMDRSSSMRRAAGARGRVRSWQGVTFNGSLLRAEARLRDQ